MATAFVDQRRQPPLSRHQAFAPLVSIWLAALLGGSLAVLPSGHAAQGLASAGLVLPPLLASDVILAIIAALAGAAAGFVAARALAALQHRSTSRTKAPITELLAPLQSEAGASEVTPILTEDPVRAEEGVLPEILQEAEVVPLELKVLFPKQAPRAAEPAAEEIILEAAPMTEHEAEPEVEPIAEAMDQPRHGKAVQLLRSHETAELAMPQLIERLAVALDDHRASSDYGAHTYTGGRPPAELADRLRRLIAT